MRQMDLRSLRRRWRVDAGDGEARLFAAAMLTAPAILIAPIAPWGAVRFLLAAIVVGWLVLAVATVARRIGAAVTFTRAASSTITTKGFVAAGAFASFLGVAAVVHLGLLQSVGGYPEVVWHIDHRYLLMHAWSLIRASGPGEVLSMAGLANPYHVGPSWLAAGAGSVLGIHPRIPLFLLFPLAAGITTLLAGYRVLRSLGATRGVALAGVGVALTMPKLHDDAVFGWAWQLGALLVRGEFLVAAAWLGGVSRRFFSPDLMLNSLLALSVVLAALAFLARQRDRVGLWTASLVIGAAVVVKPQFAIGGAGLLLALVLVGGPVGRTRLLERLFAPGLGLVLGFAVARPFIGYSDLEVAVQLPPSCIDCPSLSSTGGFVVGAVSLTVVALAALRGPVLAFEQQAAGVLAVLLAGMAGLWALLHVVAAEASPTWAWNVLQGLYPLQFVATAVGVAVLGSVSTRAAPRSMVALGMLVVVSGAAPLHQLIEHTRDPVRGYEAVDASDVRELLADVDPVGSRILVSDLADPAQDHQRAGRAFYLSNPYGHRYWITQTVYGFEQNAEARRRALAVERFFTTPWSEWHEGLLAAEGITHVAISSRCPATWDPAEVSALRAKSAAGPWSLWVVVSDEASTAGTASVIASPDGGLSARGTVSSPRFGSAACRLS
jgi:hypothetical protein